MSGGFLLPLAQGVYSVSSVTASKNLRKLNKKFAPFPFYGIQNFAIVSQHSITGFYPEPD